MKKNLQSEPTWLRRESFYLLFFSLITGIVFFLNFNPNDDILRDIVIYKYGFDYNQLYPFSTDLFDHNLWIGTDYLSYGLHLFFESIGLNDDYIYKLYQSVIGVSLLYLFTKSLLNFGYPDSYKTYVVALGFMIVSLLIVGSSRVVGARPEALFAFIAFYSLFLSPRLYIALLTLLSPLYWLAPIYSISIILNPEFRLMTWVKKGMYIVASLVLPALFWLAYMGDKYVFTVVDIFFKASSRQLSVGENASIIIMLAMPLAFFVLYFGLKGSWLFRKEPIVVSLFLVAVYFALPNMIRYAPSIVVAMLLVSAYAFKDKILQFKLDGLLFAFIIVSFIFSLIIIMNNSANSQPGQYKGKFQFPENSLVFDIDGRNQYKLVYFAEKNIKMIPTVDVAKNEPWVEDIMVQNYNLDGFIDCAMLNAQGVDYVTSMFYDIGTSKPPIPACFDFVGTDNGVKIFKLKRDVVLP